MSSKASELAVVVLAGGTSHRFGTDKLSAGVAGVPLLDRVLAALPATAEILVVGPPRDTGRAVRFVREDPPGGGPGAALIAGLLAVAATATVLVVPGDAPDSGRAAATLLEALPQDAGAAVVAVAADGREQPLQLALRPQAVRDLIALSGPDCGAGQSARRLVLGLGSALIRCPLPAAQTYDIDTQEQLASYLATLPVPAPNPPREGETR